MNFDITAKLLEKSSGEVMVYGTLVDQRGFFDDPEETVTSKEFDTAVKQVGRVSNLLIRVNSRGGSVSAGDAIADMIDNLKAAGTYVTAKIEGLGASMGAYFPQAANKVIMSRNAMMMLHPPMAGIRGNAGDLLAGAEMLEKYQKNLVALCMRRFKGSEAELIDLIEKNGELGTWLTAEEALELGLCDEISEPIEMVACADGCYRINGYSFPTDALKGAEDKITYHEVEGGEKMIYNEQTDAKIKALLDEGKTITKDGDDIVVAEVAEAQEATAFLTAEQVAEITGVKDANPDTILGMLSALSGAGVTPENADNTLVALLEKAEKTTELTAKAAERDHYFDLTLTEAIENGIRAEGNDFDKEGWEGYLKTMPLAKVKEHSDKWLAKAERDLDAGKGPRSRAPDAAKKLTIADPDQYKI